MKSQFEERPELAAILRELVLDNRYWHGLHVVSFLHYRGRIETAQSLREYYPHASEQDIQRKLADILCGEEPASRAFGPLPDSVKGPIPPNPFDEGRYATPEDIIITFLELCRQPKGLIYYWQYVLRLIRAQGDALDKEFLMHWAAEFEVTHLLEQALDEAA
jgi:hypothetical protein